MAFLVHLLQTNNLYLNMLLIAWIHLDLLIHVVRHQIKSNVCIISSVHGVCRLCSTTAHQVHCKYTFFDSSDSYKITTLLWCSTDWPLTNISFLASTTAWPYSGTGNLSPYFHIFFMTSWTLVDNKVLSLPIPAQLPVAQTFPLMYTSLCSSHLTSKGVSISIHYLGWMWYQKKLVCFPLIQKIRLLSANTH